MRITTRLGVALTLVGLLLLVLANWKGRRLDTLTNPMAEMEFSTRSPLDPPPAPSQITRTPRPENNQPTIFEALMSVLDSTEEGRALDKDQRDQLRQELSETNQVWRGMKAEMKESISRANRRFVTNPNQDVPVVPVP